MLYPVEKMAFWREPEEEEAVVEAVVEELPLEVEELAVEERLREVGEALVEGRYWGFRKRVEFVRELMSWKMAS